MDFQGKWKNIATGDYFILLNNHNGDEYILRYLNDNEELQEEKIGIFVTNESHAHMDKSMKFDSMDIWVIERQGRYRISIGNQIFEKE